MLDSKLARSGAMNMVAFGDSRRAGSALFSKLIVQGTVRNATLLVMHKNWNGGPFGLQEQAYLRRSSVAAAAVVRVAKRAQNNATWYWSAVGVTLKRRRRYSRLVLRMASHLFPFVVAA